MFCPKCGSILVPKKVGDKTLLSCSCGYTSQENEKLTLREEFRGSKGEEQLDVVESEGPQALPTTKAKCPKCGHDKAYYWLVQTRSGDEPETKFLKCVKCKHTWRDYD